MIAIMDYGMGNLRSVEKAFEYLGFDALITDDPKKVEEADHVVLPGVGAFSDAMERLREKGLDHAVLRVVAVGKPFLGICLGMQILFEASEEGGLHSGLGILPGHVTRLPECGFKIPHMGWNTLNIAKDTALLRGGEHPYAYFVHSYHVAEISPEWTSATTEYGTEFTVAVEKDNIMGMQFHPEKSGTHGLEILRRFALLK